MLSGRNYLGKLGGGYEQERGSRSPILEIPVKRDHSGDYNPNAGCLDKFRRGSVGKIGFLQKQGGVVNRM